MKKKSEKEKEKIKETVRAARASGLSYAKAGETAGVSASTARRICREEAEEKSEREKEAERSGKEGFISDAWNIIQKSIAIVYKRLEAAQTDAEALIDAIHRAVEMQDMTDKEANRLIFQLERQARLMTIPSLKELAGIISVMYDRQRIASGQDTQTEAVKPEEMELVKAVSMALKAEEKE